MKSVYQQKNFVEKTAGNIPTQSFVELQHVVGEKQSFFSGTVSTDVVQGHWTFIQPGGAIIDQSNHPHIDCIIHSLIDIKPGWLMTKTIAHPGPEC